MKKKLLILVLMLLGMLAPRHQCWVDTDTQICVNERLCEEVER